MSDPPENSTGQALDASAKSSVAPMNCQKGARTVSVSSS